MDLNEHIRDVPDFPKPGIIFKDITPLLGNPSAFDFAINAMASTYAGQGITAVVGIESRGFIFGAALALRLGCGFVPVRKTGKLPAKVKRQEYQLEYGTDTVEIHEDALSSDDKVLIVDDVLATGGTLNATISLVRSLGCTITAATCLVDLAFLGGRNTLDVPFSAILTYS